ncbi:MAG: hypothetical protein KC561_19935, partial [Myxococcales bacterium]|nr:hypothetical protein [Myxococcales bacterium]
MPLKLTPVSDKRERPSGRVTSTSAQSRKPGWLLKARPETPWKDLLGLASRMSDASRTETLLGGVSAADVSQISPEDTQRAIAHMKTLELDHLVFVLNCGLAWALLSSRKIGDVPRADQALRDASRALSDEQLEDEWRL